MVYCYSMKSDDRKGRWYRFSICEGQTIKQLQAMNDFIEELYLTDRVWFFDIFDRMIAIIKNPEVELEEMEYAGLKRGKDIPFASHRIEKKF